MCPVKHNPGEKSSSEEENVPLCPLTGTDCYREYCSFWDAYNKECLIVAFLYEAIIRLRWRKVK